MLCHICSLFMKEMKDELLNMPRRKNVEVPPAPAEGAAADQSSSADTRLILLNRDCTLQPDGSVAGLSEAGAALVAQHGLGCVTFSLHADYSHYNSEQVLRQLLEPVLPPGTEIAHSFETVGHVAHLNLRELLVPYSKLIGQV
jgi:tRNA (guanine37-N1)-methyltransferase